MTRDEFRNLHESLCYGHDAELLIENMKYFIEWNGDVLEVFKVVDSIGKKIFHLSGSNRRETVDRLFAAKINEKTLNDHFDIIQIEDIE